MAEGLTVGSGRYRLGKKIGSGAFGGIYEGVEVQTGQAVAVKLESTSAALPQLLYEAKLYGSLTHGVGIPKIHWSGTEGHYNVMVMDKLGRSLEDLFQQCNKRFDLNTIASFVEQIVDRLEYVHDRDILHRDIKPSNILLGRGSVERCRVNLVDFGLAKKYKYRKTGEHIPYRDDKSTFTGNAKFASAATHLGVEAGRRDDLESVGYMMIYLYRGRLPWERPDGEDVLLETKILSPVEKICEKCPEEFAAFLDYCRHLGFKDRPDYNYLRRLIRGLQRPREEALRGLLQKQALPLKSCRLSENQLAARPLGNPEVLTRRVA